MSPTARIGAAFTGSVRARMTLMYGGVFTIIAVGVLLGALRFQVRALSLLFGGGGGGGGRSQGGQAGPVGGDQLGQPQPWRAGVLCDQRATVNLPDCTQLPYDRTKADAARSTLDELTGPERTQDDVLNTQRLIMLISIAVIVVLAFAVCWWLTGRLLRPLHRITATAKRLSLSTLHERIALTGPDDELRRLADTFDAMLDRLERAVDSQRRFIANVSHELRTPLAVQRTAIEVGLANPTPARVERIRAELLRNTLRSERLIDGLLLLAKGERGPDNRAPVDLSAVVDEVIDENRGRADAAAVSLEPRVVRRVTVLGGEVMLAQLVTNLVQNAIRYNIPGGSVLIELSEGAGLVVSNTGRDVPEDRAAELFEPFCRLHAVRTGSDEGTGLGLSIVAAIARAHGGAITLRPNPDGGLTVRVDLPVVPAPAS